MTKPVYILNGPNLNLLGLREPAIYGRETLADVEALCADVESLCVATAKTLGLSLVFRQTNSEGTLIDHVHEAREKACGLIINAGGYTHTSVALHDALKASELPVIEVHLTNVFKREAFRHHSYISPAAVGVICGFGGNGYVLALQAIQTHLKTDKKS